MRKEGGELCLQARMLEQYLVRGRRCCHIYVSPSPKQSHPSYDASSTLNWYKTPPGLIIFLLYLFLRERALSAQYSD